MNKRGVGFMVTGLIVALLLLGPVAPAQAQKVTAKLPPMLAIATYDVGSSTYIQAGAIANELMKQLGTKTRVVPAGTDMTRTLAIKNKTAHFAFAGVGTYYFAAEGLFDFATPEWGPQPVQAVWNCFPVGGSSMVVTRDSGIKTPYDLKGKRVFWIPGAPAHNVTNTAFLAFANLTWNDVKKVEYPSYAAAARGFIEGTCDAGFNTATHSSLYELEACPRGLAWPEFPPSDKQGWKRLQAIAPYMVPFKNYGGAGQSKEGVQTMTYPFPMTVTYEWQDEDMVYQFTKAIDEAYPLYKNAYPALANWDKKISLVPGFSIPFHKGTVRYLKEIKFWNDDFEKWQQRAMARQQKIMIVWKAALTEAKQKGLKGAQFEEFWHKKHAEAIKE
jgi:uncharacterized protein